MLVRAMNLKLGDVLSDGTIVASLSRSQGHTYAKLNDGRRLIAPDYMLLGVKRPPKSASKAPERPVEGSNGSNGTIRRAWDYGAV